MLCVGARGNNQLKHRQRILYDRVCIGFILVICCLLTGCVTRTPRNINNVCHIFREYPKWYSEAIAVQRRWRVPVAVQMAIIHQESKFEATAKPPRTKLFWVIPWVRPSTAYGYAQALDGTWWIYKRARRRYFASRESFTDGVDFIGWYANQAYIRAGIRPNDPYSLYLAYHEGIGGYQRKTYLRKRWLIYVAHKVSARAQLYQAQLAACHRPIRRKVW